MFWCVLYYLGAFWTVWLPYGTRCKIGRTSKKLVPRSRVGIFRNARTRSTPLDPKIMFWCVSYYLGNLGPFGCLTELGVKQTELVQKFVPRSRVGIFCYEHNQSTQLVPKLMFWCVSYYLGAFGIVWLPYGTRSKMGRTNKKFVPRSRVVISRNARTRSTPLDPKLTFYCVLYYLGAFGTIWLPYETRCKTGRTSAKFHATKSRRIFSQ